MDFFQDDSFFMPTFMCDDPSVWEIFSRVLQKHGGGDDRIFIYDNYLSGGKCILMGGVFDGHGGSSASDFVRENLGDVIPEITRYMKEREPDTSSDTSLFVKHIQSIMCHFLKEMEDKFFRHVHFLESTRGGTTVAIVIVIGDHIFGFNLGDSTVIIRNNTTGEGIDMPKHIIEGAELDRLEKKNARLRKKPDLNFSYPFDVNPSEKWRVYEEGSSLNMSGSFGDIKFSSLSKTPYMTYMPIEQDCEYTIMLYSDGVGDIFGSNPDRLVEISNDLASIYPDLDVAERLVEEVRRCWTQTWNLEVQGQQGKFYQANMDDCSCIVLEL